MATKANMQKETVQDEVLSSKPRKRNVSLNKSSAGMNEKSAHISIRDSDGECSITEDSIRTSTPFKVPPFHPRVSKSEKKRGSSVSFSSEHSRVMELERELRKMLAERNELSKQLGSSKQQVSKLESKVQVAIRDKSALQGQVASLLKDNRDLFRGKNILLAKALSHTDPKKTRSLQQNLKQANREMRAKKKEIEMLNIRMNTSTKQLQEQLLSWLDEREEMESKIEDLECEVQYLTECNQEREEIIEQLKSLLSSQEEDNQEISKKLEELELLQKEREEEVSVLREKMSQLEAEKDHLNSQLQAVQEERVDLERRLGAAEKTSSEISYLNTCVKGQLCSVQAELSTEGKIREGVEVALAQRTEQLEEVTVQIDSMRPQHAKTVNSLQTQKKTLQTELERAQQASKESQAVLKSQLLSIKATVKEKADLKQRLEAVEQNSSEISHLNTHLEGQLCCVQAELSTEMKKRERAEIALAQCTEQLEEVTVQIDSMRSQHSETVTSLQTQNRTLQTELERAQQASKESQVVLKSELLSMEATVKEKGKAVKQWEGRYHESEERVKVVEEEKKGLRGEMERRQRENECSQSLLQSNINQVLEIAEDLKNKEKTSSSQADELKQKNLEMQQSLLSSQEQLSQAQDKIASLTEQVDYAAKETTVVIQQQMTQELDEAKQSVKRQEEQSTQLEQEMKDRIQIMEVEMEKMKHEREQLEIAYMDLEEKCRPFQDQLEGLADVNALLQSQAAIARKEAQEASDQFAQLLGHQNMRQKIRYVKKIRDENSALKVELNKLRMEISKQTKHIRRLENGVSQLHQSRPLSSKN